MTSDARKYYCVYSYTAPLSINGFRDHDLTVKSKSYFKGFNNVILMHTHQEAGVY